MSDNSKKMTASKTMAERPEKLGQAGDDHRGSCLKNPTKPWNHKGLIDDVKNKSEPTRHGVPFA
jgi:hypothetical protein